MARQLWNVRCRAHRSRDGQPCRAWAIRGGYVCKSHGGRIPQVRARAEMRLAQAKAAEQLKRSLRKALARADDRWRADPAAASADELAWLREGERRLAEFRRVNGRGPRTSAEIRLVLPP